MKITLLGCGASGGVPLIGCDCAVCTSSNPRNKRTRVSALIEHQGANILLDMSPDLRQQCLKANIKTVDAIICTHAHADHCHGIDDVRGLNFHKNGPLDLYTNEATLAELHTRFPYAFSPRDPAHGWYKPQFTTHVIRPDEAQVFEVKPGVSIRCFDQIHGRLNTIGLRIENVAYSVDVRNFREQFTQHLENLDLWVVDCLQFDPAPTHAHLALALEWIERFKPKRAILTHMSHVFDYDALKSQLPPHVEPAHDGMVIEI